MQLSIFSFLLHIAGNKEFNQFEKLKQFKWTFKKSSDNNYYFVSVTPVI